MNEPANITGPTPIKIAWQLLLGCCAILLLIGHFLPWAAYKSAALTLSANDLGFFTNFTPGAGIFWNEWFYLPVWVAALLLVMGYSSRTNRLLMMALALGTASLGLPRYEQLIKFIRTPMQALRESDFVLQLVLTLLVMGLVVVLMAIPAKLLRLVKFRYIGLGMAALLCAVPLAGYIGIRPFVAELYRDGIGIGTGWWLTLLADLLLWAMTFATILVALAAHRTPTTRTN